VLSIREPLLSRRIATRNLTPTRDH